jgi:hypothetical protein
LLQRVHRMLGRGLNRLLDAGRGPQGDDLQAIRGALEDFLDLANLSTRVPAARHRGWKASRRRSAATLHSSIENQRSILSCDTVQGLFGPQLLPGSASS